MKTIVLAAIAVVALAGCAAAPAMIAATSVVGGAAVDYVDGKPLCHNKGGVSDQKTQTPYGSLSVCNDDAQ